MLKGVRKGLKGDRWLVKTLKIKGILVAGLGFEPRQAESESAVLPLHNPAGKKIWLKRHLLCAGC
jgi:hypothetical protein